MNKRPWLRHALALCALPLAGCGADVTAPSTASLDAFEAAYVDTFCDVLMRCRRNDIVLNQWRVLLSGGRCAPIAREGNAARFRAWRTAVAAGRIRFDGAEAARALSLVRTQCIGSTPDVDAALSGALVGTLPPGAACTLHAECAGGYCADTSHGAGTCRPRVALGGACAYSYECAAVPGGWARCGGDGVQSACAAVRPRPEARVGAACGIARLSLTEVARTGCEAGAFCSAAIGEGVCRATLSPGAACEQGDVCGDTAACLGPGGCTAVALTSEVGAACGEGGRVCDPQSNLQCVAGRCARAGDGTLGARCVPGPGYRTCGPGLTCDFIDERCVATRPAGARCGDAYQCQSGSCVSGAAEGEYVCAAVWVDPS